MKTLWLVLMLLTFGSACRADRDIVYAARYYTPPGSHRTSHFHIYRINPDGTGKTQMTFGSADEEMPKWSSDGRHITFLENTRTPKPLLLCEIDANGGRRRVLKPLGEISYPHTSPAAGYRLENTGDDAEDADSHGLVNLKTGHQVTLTVPDHGSLFDTLLPAPGGGLVYADNQHNSTVGTDYLFYRLNPETGKLQYLTEGQFLIWSPDGSLFCTAPGRGTDFYARRPGAEDRTVWTAPLYVRAAAGGKMHALTPRLSWVTGADWRKGK